MGFEKQVNTSIKNMVGSTKKRPGRSETYKIINNSTETVLSLVILQFLESIIADMDRISMKMKTCFTSAYKGIQMDDNGIHKSHLTLEETLYQRAEAVMELLSSFVVMNLKGKLNHSIFYLLS